MGIFYVNAQIGSASAPWIAEALLRFHASVPFFVLGIIPVIAFLLGLMIPETKGKIMEDFVRNSHEGKRLLIFFVMLENAKFQELIKYHNGKEL